MNMLALIVGTGDAGLSHVEADSVSACAAAAAGYSSPVKVTGKCNYILIYCRLEVDSTV